MSDDAAASAERSAVSTFTKNRNSKPAAAQSSNSPRSSRVGAARTQDVLGFLIAFRLLNALIIRTFFQPDEYFQSLEPGWQLAFGKNSGAWITWVRHRQCAATRTEFLTSG